MHAAAPAGRPHLRLALVGFGHVGRRLVSLLDEMADALPFTAEVVAIATRRHGLAIDTRGLDTAEALVRVSRGDTLAGLHTGPGPVDTTGTGVLADVAQRCAGDAARGHLVCVESTVLDITRGEPACSHIATALAHGLHAVTVNKGPAAFAAHTLTTEARRRRRWFLHEGAVMDGIPVFNLVRETLPGVRVTGFRGVINTTTNFVLSALAGGQPFGDAVAEMQARGIAEADPSLDIDGWDAAAKTAALVNVLMHGRLSPHDVIRTGIGHLTADDVRQVETTGHRLRLVASATRTPNGIRATVAPCALPSHDPLAGVADTDNALYLSLDPLGEFGIVQRGGTLTHTAYAVVTDLARIARSPIPEEMS
jgi:homoserine dehydrogenase